MISRLREVYWVSRCRVLLAALLIAGCLVDAAPCPAQQYTLGVAMHFMRDDYANAVVQSIKKTAGATAVVVTDANGQAAKQLADVENLIARKVSAIIVVPIDEKAILPAIRAANESRIPVVAITRIPRATVVSTIASNGDYANGKASGELLRNSLGGKGKIAVIALPYSLWRIDERERGLHDALAGSGIQIVARQAGTDQANIQDSVSGILIANPDLAGIWCSFSNQIVGAADALRLARKHIVLTGIDAVRSIIERIRKGWVTGTAAQFPAEHGRLAAEAALRQLRGQPVAASYEVPVGVVTKANADEMQRRIWNE
jgi:ABC-type sugar transport system substrate-binding protein